MCSLPSTSGYPHLQELHLSEFLQDEPVDHIDMLIGSDHYLDVVTGDVAREEMIQLELTASLDGFGLPPLKQKENPVITNLAVQEVASTVLCTDNNELQANLHRFWEVESIGILERSELEEVYQFLNTHVCHSTSSRVNMR